MTSPASSRYLATRSSGLLRADNSKLRKRPAWPDEGANNAVRCKSHGAISCVKCIRAFRIPSRAAAQGPNWRRRVPVPKHYVSSFLAIKLDISRAWPILPECGPFRNQPKACVTSRTRCVNASSAAVNDCGDTKTSPTCPSPRWRRHCPVWSRPAFSNA